MWLRHAQHKAKLAVLLLAPILGACSGVKADRGAFVRLSAPRIDRRLDPTDLFPTDLDLVLRVDVARMRAGVGSAAANDLTARALRETGEDVVENALACADVVWLATRLGEIDAGDHVLVLEGKDCAPHLNPEAWQSVPSANREVTIFARKKRASRNGTARIINLGTRATAFISPIEVDSVNRVLRDGPDERRGDPTASGLASIDLRAHRLSPRLERRFRAFGAVIAGVERIRASAVLGDEGLRIEADIVGRTPASASLAFKFLTSLRDSGQQGRYAAVLSSMELETIERTIRLKWVVPAHIVLSLLAPEPPSPSPPSP